MLPLPLPPGTTLASLVETLLPAAHAASVPASAPREPITLVLSLAGSRDATAATPPPRVYTLVVRGPTLTVSRDEAATRDVWIHAEGVIADHFVADWSAGASLAPRWKTVPGKAEVPALLTDPRILRRVQMVNGRVELALSDFSLGRAALTLASGAAAKKPIEPGRADVTIELTMKTFDQVLAGELRPDTAIADGRFALSGKKMIALQYAFAIGPFFQGA
jgi:hypothetical protein